MNFFLIGNFRYPSRYARKSLDGVRALPAGSLNTLIRDYPNAFAACSDSKKMPTQGRTVRQGRPSDRDELSDRLSAVSPSYTV
jgi:hypothetical protein